MVEIEELEVPVEAIKLVEEEELESVDELAELAEVRELVVVEELAELAGGTPQAGPCSSAGAGAAMVALPKASASTTGFIMIGIPGDQPTACD